MSYSSILILSDLSERSDLAVARGFALARQIGAKVTLASAIDDAIPCKMASDLSDRVRAHLQETVAQAGSNVRCSIVVEIGDPQTRMIEMMTDPTFDLVVVGRHRPRVLLDALTKPTVEKLIEAARKPVLVVSHPERGPYQRMLALTAFSQACAHAGAMARHIAPTAQTRVIHAWMSPFEGLTGGHHSDMAHAEKQDIEARAEAWRKETDGALPPVELIHGGLGTVLAEKVNAFKPDLLVVGAHTRSIGLLGLGNFARDLLRDPPTDLLIARSG